MQNGKLSSQKHPTRKTTISRDKTRGTSQDLQIFIVIYLCCFSWVQGGTEFRISYLPEIILRFMLDRAFPGAAAAVSGDAAGAAAAWSEAAAAAY